MAVGARTTALRRAVATDFRRFRAAELLPGTAARASLAVALVLVAGVAAGSPGSAVAAAAGAFSVGIASFQGAYRTRLQATVAASLAMAASTFVGALADAYALVAVLVIALWGFAAGLVTVLGTAATVVGIQAGVALLIAGQFEMTPAQAALRALLVLVGGLLQTLLVVAGWPLRTYAAERDALAPAYAALADAAQAAARGEGVLPPPGTLDAAAAVLADPHPLSGGAVRVGFRTLLDQAVRIRGELSALAHARERAVARGRSDSVRVIDEELVEAADRLHDVAEALAPALVPARLRHPPAPPRPNSDADVDSRLVHLTPSAAQTVRALRGELRAAARAATRLGESRSAAPEPPRDLPPDVRLLPPLAEPLATLRASLDLSAESFRHALRLGCLLAVSAVLARLLPMPHAYWIALTALVVLRPDFTSTIGRGTSRVLGTATGAGVATVVVAELRPGREALVALVVFSAFCGYTVFRASPALFSVVLTCYVVFLLALVGLPGPAAALDRLAATALGGALALAAYAVWPTWERMRLPDRLAALVDAQAGYAAAVLGAYASADARRDPAPLLRAQGAARRARAAAEASLERAARERHLEAHAGGEPDAVGVELSLAAGVVAAMQRSALAALTLHSRLPGVDGEVLPPAAELAADIRANAATLVRELRHDPVPLLEPTAPPSLRASYARTLSAVDEATVWRRLLRVEADEIINAYATVWDLVRAARTGRRAPG